MLRGNDAVEILCNVQSALSGVWERDRHTIDVFMDFEFWDRGSRGLHTISGGLVLVAGGFNNIQYLQRRFYFVNTDFFGNRENGFREITDAYLSGDDNAKWLHDNVFKYIIHAEDHHGKRSSMQWAQDHIDLSHLVLPIKDSSLISGETQTIGSINDGDIRKALQDVIDSFAIAKPTLRIWGYYPAHDHVCLCSIFGAMVDMPEEWKFYDYDLRAMTDIYGYEHDDFNPEPANPHHALHDAYSQYLTTRALFKRLREDNVIDFADNVQF